MPGHAPPVWMERMVRSKSRARKFTSAARRCVTAASQEAERALFS